MTNEKNRAICILGMHRSGTSAVARSVNLLGPYLGREEHLMQPVGGDNPHGFWEHWSVFSLHERLLSHLCSSWDSILPLPEDWWKQPGISPYREELKHLIKSEFSGQKLWMWKDPRTSLLLHLWKDVMQELDIDTYYILCVRNPLDVAASLSRRNNFPKSKSLSLWLLYTASSLYWTASAKRIVLHFDNLVENWEPQLRRVSNFLSLSWPQDNGGFRKSMTDFLHPGDRHSRSDTELLLQDKEVAEPVKKTYRLLLESLKKDDILDSEWFSKEVDTIYGNYCAYAKMFALQNERHKSPEGWRSRTQRKNISNGREEDGYPETPCNTETRTESLLFEELSRIVFPTFSSHQASIIVPVWNHWKYTYRCLEAILANTNEVAYEVIIIDNGSSDKTEEMLVKAENVRVVRNQSNAGYVLASNQGAAAAKGKYLVFLNNDTEPLPGWLKELVSAADADPEAGAVGGKLIYPDGRLQEAGGMIFSDGRGWNFGKGDDPDEELYNVMCEVDYCSGACLLVRKDLFDAAGGFDTRYAPAYYEEADLCFGVRKMGYKILYNPDVTVVHHESVTAGSGEAVGLIEINRGKFIEKWRNELMLQDAHPSETGSSPITSCRERLIEKNPLPGDVADLPVHEKAVFSRHRDSSLPDKFAFYAGLEEKKNKSLEVIEKTAGLYGSVRVGVVWTGDKDSTAVLHMIMQASGGHIPFTVIRIATNDQFPEIRDFMERLHDEWAFTVWSLANLTGEETPRQPTISDCRAEDRASIERVTLNKAVETLGLKALVVASRWDERKPLPACTYFSLEKKPLRVRVQPILHFKEVDIWHYIKKYSVPICDMDSPGKGRVIVYPRRRHDTA